MSVIPHDRYPGPPPFEDTPEDHSVFFGRADEIRTLTQEIIASPLLVLFGKSGLGKTSLMQAGVFPELRAAGLLPIRVRLSASGAPLQLITDSARKASLECRDIKVDYVAGELVSAWAFFKTAMFWREDSLLIPVLVFDQFEEIFTLIDAKWRRAFAEEVGPLVSGNPPAAVRQRPKASTGVSLGDASPKVKVVFSLREEYLGSLQELGSEIPGLFRDRFRLLPLSEEQGRQAIVGPAGKPGAFGTPPFKYQEETLKRMLDYLKGRSGNIEPFQLQLLCQHAEQKIVKPLVERKDGPGSASPIEIAPQQLGDRSAMEAVMQGFYKDSLQQLPWHERRRAQVLCDTGLLLSTGNRTSLQEDQVRHDYHIAEETLKHLVDKRILRVEPRLEGRSFEISHDTLAQAILQTRPWRLPTQYKIAAAVLFAAVLLLALFSYRLHQARATAEAETRTANDARKNADFALNQEVTERKRADAETARAEESRRKAEALVAFLIGEDLLGKIRPMGRLEVLTDVQREVNKYLESLKGVPEESYSELALQNQGLSHLNQGDLYRQTYELKKAAQEYEEAQHAFGTLLQRDNKRREWRHYLADATAKLASVAADQFHLTKALRLNRKALDIQKSLIAERSGAEDKVLRDEADSHVRIGGNLESQGHLKEALGEYEETVRLAKKASRDTTEWLYLLQDGFAGEGAVLNQQGRMTEAEAALKEALDCALRASANSPFEPEARYRVGIAHNSLANLKTFENPEQVLPEYQELHNVIADVAKWDPKNKQWQRDLAATLLLVGEGYEYRRAADSALESYQDALRIFDTLKPIDDSNKSLVDDFVWLYRDWGDALMEKEQITDNDRRNAVARYDEALKSVLELIKIDSSNTDLINECVYLRTREVGTLNEQGEFDKALESATQGLRLVDSLPFLDPTDAQYWEMVRELHQEMASTLLAKGDYAGSLKAYRQALQAEEKAVSLQPGNALYHSALALVHRQMGDQLRGQRKLAEATAAYARSEQALRDAIGLKADAGYWNSLFLLFYDHVAPLHSKQGDQSGTLNAYHAALESEEKAIALDPKNAVYHSNLYLTQQQIGDQLRDQGELAEAAAAYERTEKALDEGIKIGTKEDAVRYRNALSNLFSDHLAKVYAKQGDKAGMLKAYQRAVLVWEEQVRLEPNNAEYRNNLAVVHQQVGDHLRDQNEITEALAAYTSAERIWRDAIAIKGDASYWHSLFELFGKEMAPVQEQQKDPAALKAYRQALEAAKTAATLQPKNADYHADLAWARWQIGNKLREQGELIAAEASYVQSEEALADAARLKPETATYWEDRFVLLDYGLAPLREQQKDVAGTLKTYREALEAIEKAMALQPDNAAYHYEAALVQREGGDALREQGEFGQALSAYTSAEGDLRQAIKLKDKDASYWNELCVLLCRLALLPENQGQQARALELYREAREAINKAMELDPKEEQYGANLSQVEASLKRLKSE